MMMSGRGRPRAERKASLRCSIRFAPRAWFVWGRGICIIIAPSLIRRHHTWLLFSIQPSIAPASCCITTTNHFIWSTQSEQESGYKFGCPLHTPAAISRERAHSFSGINLPKHLASSHSRMLISKLDPALILLPGPKIIRFSLPQVKYAYLSFFFIADWDRLAPIWIWFYFFEKDSHQIWYYAAQREYN